jgi:UPF0755 protein
VGAGEDEREWQVARLSRSSKWFIAAALVVVAAIAGGLWVLDGRLNPLGAPDVDPGEPVEVTVEPGSSVRAVGEQLAELGVVSSAFRFRTAAEEADLAASLQPGSFELETGMGEDAAISALAAGPIGGIDGGIRFTVQEGLTVAQTLERLDEQFDDLSVDDFRAVLDERVAAGENAEGVLELPDWVPEPGDAGEEVIEPFEGLLFPQTYDVSDDATARDILQRMLDQLITTANALPQEEVDVLEAQGLDRYEGLVLASLIERETRVDTEREEVSGVIANRLEDGMRLQIDASAQYAAGNPTDQVANVDTSIDSPYNTYQIDGFPPTPISGVGEASFLAAYRPGETTARYYVLDPECDGTHRFAETLDEHNANVRAFRDGGRCAEEIG